ncbi:hypothetical protein V6N11_044283 [Hibiscus sabdariffa]|uniref:Uncharacterized protein n=1 Tax=Hibiscus sabdariffa TaxID=183260 RepID=A0ABR2REW8_9ROSI
MELKDLQSDLEALRELYGLINCGEVTCNVVQLGERSKVLLKNLLDDATKTVLETHEKIIAAAEHGSCGNSCSSESGNRRALLKFQPSVSSNMLQATPTPDAIRNFVKEPNHPAFSSLNGEDSPNWLTTWEVMSQQSRLTFSLDKPENRKKNCEYNKKNSIKEHGIDSIISKDAKQQGWRCDSLGYFYQASGDDKKLLERNETNTKLLEMNETMRQSSICGLRGSPSFDRSVASSSTSVASGDIVANLDEKEGEAVNNFFKDIDNTVKHIESHISALRLCSKLADATKAAVPHGVHKMPTSLCSTGQPKEHSVKKNEPSHAVDPFPDRDDLQLLELISQRNEKKDNSNGSHYVLGQSTNDFFDDISSKRRRIQDKEIDQTCKHTVRSNSRLNKKVGNWNVFGMLEADDHKQNETTDCYVHGLRIPTKLGDITKRSPMPEKMPSLTPIDGRGKESLPNIAKLRLKESLPNIAKLRLKESSPNIAKLRPKESLPNIAKLRPKESSPNIAKLRPSQSTVSMTGSHKKSLAHEILPEQKKAGKGTLRNQIVLQHQEPEESSTSSSGSSGSEPYSLASKDTSASISSRYDHGGGEESSSSTSSDYRGAGESSKSYATRTHKLIHPANLVPEKGEGQRLGRLRKLKDKLAVIFHHHHHHHHHHRHGHHDRGDHSHGAQTKAQTKSMWTPLNKLFHPINRNKVEEDKSRKERASIVAVKKQGGQFPALVGGLMRHLRQSKKSKTSKGGMGRLGKIKYKKNMKAKQLHWWQMFQSHGGLKLPSKRRVKVGFMSKKNKLKLPKLPKLK